MSNQVEAKHGKLAVEVENARPAAQQTCRVEQLCQTKRRQEGSANPGGNRVQHTYGYFDQVYDKSNGMMCRLCMLGDYGLAGSAGGTAQRARH